MSKNKREKGTTKTTVPVVSKSPVTKTEAIEAAITALDEFSPKAICSYANTTPKTQLECRDCTSYNEMLAAAKGLLPGKATVSKSKDVEQGHLVNVRYDGKTIAVVVTNKAVPSTFLLTVETIKLILAPKHLTHKVAPVTEEATPAVEVEAVEVIELATA